jgi:hypothetical protein
LIRSHGASIHSLPALKAVVDEPWVDVIHARINPEGVAMDGQPEEVVPVLKQIHDAGKGIIGMKIIGAGSFGKDAARREASVRYALGLGTIDTMVIGFKTPQQITEIKNLVKLALAEPPNSSEKLMMSPLMPWPRQTLYHLTQV